MLKQVYKMPYLLRLYYSRVKYRKAFKQFKRLGFERKFWSIILWLGFFRKKYDNAYVRFPEEFKEYSWIRINVLRKCPEESTVYTFQFNPKKVIQDNFDDRIYKQIDETIYEILPGSPVE